MRREVTTVFHDHWAYQDVWRVSLIYQEGDRRINIGISLPKKMVSDHAAVGSAHFGETNGQTIERLIGPIRRLLEAGVEITGHVFTGRDQLRFSPVEIALMEGDDR